MKNLRCFILFGLFLFPNIVFGMQTSDSDLQYFKMEIGDFLEYAKSKNIGDELQTQMDRHVGDMNLLQFMYGKLSADEKQKIHNVFAKKTHGFGFYPREEEVSSLVNKLRFYVSEFEKEAQKTEPARLDDKESLAQEFIAARRRAVSRPVSVVATVKDEQAHGEGISPSSSSNEEIDTSSSGDSPRSSEAKLPENFSQLEEQAKIRTIISLSGVNVPKKSGVNVPKKSGVNVPKKSGVNVPEESGVNVPKKSGVNVPEEFAFFIATALVKEGLSVEDLQAQAKKYLTEAFADYAYKGNLKNKIDENIITSLEQSITMGEIRQAYYEFEMNAIILFRKDFESFLKSPQLNNNPSAGMLKDQIERLKLDEEEYKKVVGKLFEGLSKELKDKIYRQAKFVNSNIGMTLPDEDLKGIVLRARVIVSNFGAKSAIGTKKTDKKVAEMDKLKEELVRLRAEKALLDKDKKDKKVNKKVKALDEKIGKLQKKIDKLQKS